MAQENLSLRPEPSYRVLCWRGHHSGPLYIASSLGKGDALLAVKPEAGRERPRHPVAAAGRPPARRDVLGRVSLHGPGPRALRVQCTPVSRGR